MLNTALYERTQILIGDAGIRALQQTSILLVGTGGVGGHCAEALVRSGVGHITLIDFDVVSSTNKNRQLIALDSNIGKSKVEELTKRLRDINAQCAIVAMDAILLPEDVHDILQRKRYDYVVDCIDSVECKIALLDGAVKAGVRVYCSGGAGGLLDPSHVHVGDLFDTKNDRLARACRVELRKRGIERGDITIVHSTELRTIPPLEPQRQEAGGRERAINGTISYMPPLFGLLLASAVIRCAVDPRKHDEEKAKALKLLKKKEKKAEKAKTRPPKVERRMEWRQQHQQHLHQHLQQQQHAVQQHDGQAAPPRSNGGEDEDV